MTGISDKEARALINGAKREGVPKTIADGTVPGLTLTVSKTGFGAWVFRYYAASGKRKETTIGQYPTWGIKEARDKASALRRAVDEGVDVAIVKQRTKREAVEAMTVDGLASAYFEMAEKDLHPHTFKQRFSLHARYVSPVMGSWPAATVKAADVVEVIKKSATGGKTLPNITLTHVSLLFAHAVGNGIRETNPCRDLKLSAIVGKPDTPKQRTALNADELGKFLPALDTIPRQYALAVRLLLLTGVRISQLTEAKIEEFNLETGLWSVPHERRKNRRYTTGPFVIPLPAQAVAWVRELIVIADRNAYLLPVEMRRHSDARNSMSKRTTVADWLDRMHQQHPEGWRRITPHDLRSTCKSGLSTLRVDNETRQRYLDHALGGMDGIYDKADYLSHRRAAADLWLGFLGDCESGKEAAKVVRLLDAA